MRSVSRLSYFADFFEECFDCSRSLGQDSIRTFRFWKYRYDDHKDQRERVGNNAPKSGVKRVR